MIKIYNRKTNSYEEEKVAGEKYLSWCYESPVGKTLTELLIKKKLVSRLYGKYCDTTFSKRKISKFIKDFDIDMDNVKKSENEFSSFNDFFIRELNSNARPMDKNQMSLPSPGDGRLFAYENISMNDLVQVKGITYSLSELLGDNDIAKEYNITVDTLKKINNLSSDKLTINQQLFIPKSDNSSVKNTGEINYIVQKGDNLWTIANKYDTTIDDIKKLNNLKSNTLQIGQVLKIPGSTNYNTYTVKKGDSLWKIADKYGTSVNKLMTINNLKSTTLQIGQNILIPTN